VAEKDDAKARKNRADRLRREINSFTKKQPELIQEPAEPAGEAVDIRVETDATDLDAPRGSPAAPDFRSFIHKRMRELGADQGED